MSCRRFGKLRCRARIPCNFRANLPNADIQAAEAQALSEKQIEQPVEPAAPSNPRIDDVLATLDSQRGHSRPMPTFNEIEDSPEPDIAGSHPQGDPTFSDATSPHVLPSTSAETAESGDSGAGTKRALSVAKPLTSETFDPEEEQDKAHHPAGSRAARGADTRKKRQSRHQLPLETILPEAVPIITALPNLLIPEVIITPGAVPVMESIIFLPVV